ncbi:MAG: aminotransferase class I/II-fold pyridoxal phosphate-dependent enzyme, partial [Lachnospirales bacterium]
MISDKMKNLVANSSVIRAMFTDGKIMAEKYGAENVYNFSLGNPSIVPPPSVKKAIIDVLNEESEMELHGYMDNAGYTDVREAIADFTNKSYGTSFTSKNIIMTVGAAGGLNVCLKSLVNAGDEVMVIAPYFGEYNSYIANVDGVKVVVEPDYERFSINFAELEAKITPKTKFLIINSPNNPTGAVYTEEDIIKLAEILNKKQAEYGTSIYLFSDEPYREIAFNNTVIPYVPNYYKNTVVGY